MFRSGPCGNRTRLSGRPCFARCPGQRPVPIDERAVLECDEQELNLQILAGWLGYGQLGLPMPNRRVLLSMAQAGLEPAVHQGLSLAALPICVPRHLPPAPSTGFEPAISCVTGRRALQAAPRGQRISNGPGGTRTGHRRGTMRSIVPVVVIPGSKPRWSAGCLPGRAQGRNRTRIRLGLSQAALPIGVPGQSSSPGWSRTIVSWVWTKRRCRWTTGLRSQSGVTESRTRISGLRSQRRPVGP